MSNGRIFFGYPYYDKVDGVFMGCVLRMLLADFARDRLLVSAQGVEGLYVSNNRNILTRAMLKSRANWLLMADTDTVFKDDLPKRMLDAANEVGQDAKIVAVDLPLGSQDHAGMKRLSPGVWVPSERSAGWHDGAATAIVMIHREVFGAISAAQSGPGGWFLHGHYLKDGEWIDEKEDMAFCGRALDMDMGYKTWVTDTVWARHSKKVQLPNKASDDGTSLVTIAPGEVTK